MLLKLRIGTTVVETAWPSHSTSPSKAMVLAASAPGFHAAPYVASLGRRPGPVLTSREARCPYFLLRLGSRTASDISGVSLAKAAWLRD